MLSNEELQGAIVITGDFIGRSKPLCKGKDFWQSHLSALLDIQRIRASTCAGINYAAPTQDGQADKIGRLTRALEAIAFHGALDNCSGKWCSDVATLALKAEEEAHHDGA